MLLIPPTRNTYFEKEKKKNILRYTDVASTRFIYRNRNTGNTGNYRFRLKPTARWICLFKRRSTRFRLSYLDVFVD